MFWQDLCYIYKNSRGEKTTRRGGGSDDERGRTEVVLGPDFSDDDNDDPVHNPLGDGLCGDERGLYI
ncbi:hypothetical protein FACS1894196_2820 [Clostridia bacterium]|nr:hypothetical protein FACS1894196_2820 [Clostridia bacterium]